LRGEDILEADRPIIEALDSRDGNDPGS